MASIHGSGLWVPGTDIFVNGGFLVNQRAKTSYRVPGNTYTVDRWKSNLDAQIDVVADGIKVHSLGIAYSGIWQHTENLYLHTGDTFTFSAEFPEAPPPGWYIDAQVVRVSDGVGVCGNNTIGHDLRQGINYITFTMPNETNGLHFIRCFICNCLSEDTLAHVHRAKLEPGPISTLAYDAPPDVAVELGRCQRYFVPYVCTTLSPGSNGWFGTGINWPIEMRTVPAIQLTDLVANYYGGAGTRFDIAGTSGLTAKGLEVICCPALDMSKSYGCAIKNIDAEIH